MKTYYKLSNMQRLTADDRKMSNLIKRFTWHVKNKKYSLKNKKSMENWWNELISYLNDTMGRFSDGSSGFSAIRAKLGEYGLGTWRSTILTLKDGGWEFLAKNGFYVDNILCEISRRYGKRGKNYIKKYGEGKRIYSEDEIMEEFDMNDWSRIIVCRTKYGEFGKAGVLYYWMHGAMTSENVQDIKAAYAVQMGCNYFMVRPCLLSNWLEWDEERKIKSCIDDIEYSLDIE